MSGLPVEWSTDNQEYRHLRIQERNLLRQLTRLWFLMLEFKTTNALQYMVDWLSTYFTVGDTVDTVE
ncbi:hypothetical protein PROFUN_15733 [Planoprotostelium fungivorum]|uniref:Uncharacterized protein n=1 Tax=Planoprotostelium fungivorum TaxID=1890364 RepID=A0A2P6MUQ4_9EUKA|nr:hypothetical protein PROFUN_15733 [Planoprotostelium fungivorum]